MYKVLSAAGLQPAFMAGHSFGELTALWAAGAMDDETFYRLAMERGKAMAAQTDDDADAGAMLAVKADYEIVHRELADLEGVIIANVNSPNQTVVGGASHLIREAARHLDAKGFSVTPLTVSAAFHTPFVEHAQKPFAAVVADAAVQAPRIPVFSNTTAQPYPDQTAEVKRLLQNHMLESVWFKHSIEHIYQAGGRVFVEFGPRAILSSLVAETLQDQDFLAVSLNANSRKDSDLQFRLGVLQLRVAGIALNDIDEDLVSARLPGAKGKLNVKLNGSNYVSAETREAYEKALQEPIKVNNNRTTTVRDSEKDQLPAAAPPAASPSDTYSSEPAGQGLSSLTEVNAASPPDTSSIHQHQKETDMQPELIQLLQSALDHYRTQQDKNQELLESYLHEQSRQFESLLAAIKGRQAPAANGQPAAVANKTAAPVEMPQPKPVVPVPKAPTPPPAAQAPAVKPPAPKPVQPAPQPETVKRAPAAPAADTEKLGKLLLEIVSEKTGYPAEMLELGMDVEADLGIDSIKRVEIFGAVKENYPETGDVNPQALGELRTLQQIVDYFAGRQTQTAPAKAPVTAPAPAVTAAVQPQTVAPNGVHAPAEPDNGKLSALLLEIVSEKTGYPAEMLELSMDIEADLGIDSIKRVEIFGAVKENYPEVGEINPQELGELRTLQQIVDYFQRSKKGNGLSPN
jgi:acyl transferase domain-containing protein